MTQAPGDPKKPHDTPAQVARFLDGPGDVELSGRNAGASTAPAGAPPPSVPPVGSGYAGGARFGPYEIVRELGRGGMGVVYLARQPGGTEVALKVLHEEAARDPEFVARFRREAGIVKRLSNPALVKLLDHGEVDGRHYIAMEYVNGVTLRGVLRRGPLPSVHTAVGIACAVLEGLHEAHEAGIVHRDVKPENILLDRDARRVYLTDFGVARIPGQTLTGTNEAIGTPHYMAPEQLNNPRAVDPRTDIYAVGVVLYEMLTGEVPVGRFLPPSLKCDVTHELSRIVMRATSAVRDRRYATAQEMLRELRDPSVMDAALDRRASAHRIRRPNVPRPIALVLTSLMLLMIAAISPSGRTLRTIPWMALACGALSGVLLIVRLLRRPTAGPRPRVRWLVVACVLCAGAPGVAWLRVNLFRRPDPALEAPQVRFPNERWLCLLVPARNLSHGGGHARIDVRVFDDNGWLTWGRNWESGVPDEWDPRFLELGEHIGELRKAYPEVAILHVACPVSDRMAQKIAAGLREIRVDVHVWDADDRQASARFDLNLAEHARAMASRAGALAKEGRQSEAARCYAEALRCFPGLLQDYVERAGERIKAAGSAPDRAELLALAEADLQAALDCAPWEWHGRDLALPMLRAVRVLREQK